MASKDVIVSLKKSIEFYGKFPYSDKSKEILVKTVDRTIKYFNAAAHSAYVLTPHDEAKALIDILNELKTELKKYTYDANDKAGVAKIRNSLKEYSKKIDKAYSKFASEYDRRIVSDNVTTRSRNYVLKYYGARQMGWDRD